MKLSTGDIKFSVVLHPKNEERSLKWDYLCTEVVCQLVN